MAAACVAGCANHYAVTDNASKRVYYTSQVETQRGGLTVFKDERTGERVTLTSSEVRQISTAEYEAGIKK